MVQPTHQIFKDGCSRVSRSRAFNGHEAFDSTQTLKTFEATQQNNPSIFAPCPGLRCQDCDSPSIHADSVMISVDGACRGNGRPGAIAACAVFLTPESPYNETHILGGDDPLPTSQRAELMGGIKALEAAKRLAVTPGECWFEDLKQVVIKTDSAYLVQGATEWISKWKNRGWTNVKGLPVVNQDLFQRLEERIRELECAGVLVQFFHVPRWQNQQADAAAKKALDTAKHQRNATVQPPRGKEVDDDDDDDDDDSYTPSASTGHRDKERYPR